MYIPDNQIIVEGPDLSGKSTVSILAQVITGLSSYHAGAPPKTPIEACARVYSYPYDEILDRHFCISEQIYGPLLRGKTLLQTEWMVEHLLKDSYTVLYCRLPLDYLTEQIHYLNKSKKEYKSKFHVKQVIEQYTEIHQQYDIVMSILKAKKACTIIPVDFRSITSKKLQRAIKGADNECKRRRQR